VARHEISFVCLRGGLIFEGLQNLLVLQSNRALSSSKSSCDNDESSEVVLGPKPMNDNTLSDHKEFNWPGNCILLLVSPQSNAQSNFQVYFQKVVGFFFH